MSKRVGLMNEVIEVIITHPKDTITSKEIQKEISGLSPKQVTNAISHLAREGYLESTKLRESMYLIYKIKKRTVPEKRVRLKSKELPMKPKKDDIDAITIANGIVGLVNELKAKNYQLVEDSRKESIMRNKEIKDMKYDLKKKDDKIRELVREVERLRNTIRTQNGKTITMKDIARFTPQS